MRALVSGISGFAGSHLAEHLLASGDQVLGISRSGKWHPDVPASVSRQIAVGSWDLAEDLTAETRDRLASFAPEVIYHLGAISVPAECGRDEPTAAARETNVDGTRRLLELAAGLSTPCRFLLASSCYVYQQVDAGSPQVTEESALAPPTAYGKTKLEAEQLAQQFAAEGSVDVIIARAFQHTGPRQSPRMIVPDWARQFAKNQNPVRVVCLDTFLDLSDVRDVVRAYRAITVDGKSGAIYNVGSGKGCRSGDVFFSLQQLCDPDRQVVELAPGRRQHPIADISRIQHDTHWAPEIDLDQTLQDTYRYWKDRLEPS